ncbi:MOSC N-terminal beta barrel domain-containing protein, partial [Streptomyces microflavus]
MASPVLRSVHVYPVKSLAAHTPGEVALEPRGLDGVRRWLVVD